MIILNFIFGVSLILSMFISGLKLIDHINCNNETYFYKMQSKLNKTLNQRYSRLSPFCKNSVTIKGNFKGYVTNQSKR